MNKEIMASRPPSSIIGRSNGKTRARRWYIAGGILAVLTAIILFTNWPAQLLARPLTLHEDPRASDVVIVLGAGARKSGNPLPPQAQQRVQKGFDLIEQGYASRMILSGGLSKKSGYVEAQLMEAYAATLGAAPEVIIEENMSTDTWENANFSLAKMAKNDWHTALVVTSSYHTLRSCLVFRKLKANVRCISAPLDTGGWSVYEHITDLRSVVREYGALVYYFIKHYIW